MKAEERARRERPGFGSGPFLMEMIFVTGFFMICASICVMVFMRANTLSARARNLNQAVLAAQTLAEELKSQNPPVLGTELLDEDFLEKASQWKEEEPDSGSQTPREEILESEDAALYVLAWDQDWNRYENLDSLEKAGKEPAFAGLVYQGWSDGILLTDIEIYQYGALGGGGFLFGLSSDCYQRAQEGGGL